MSTSKPLKFFSPSFDRSEQLPDLVWHPPRVSRASGEATKPDITFPNPTKSSGAREISKTNPNSRSAAQPLSPRQLAAVRHLSAGKRVGVVAAALRVTRQTISTWKRDPRFRAELARVHALLIGVSPRLPTAGPARTPAALNRRPAESDAPAARAHLKDQFKILLLGVLGVLGALGG